MRRFIKTVVPADGYEEVRKVGERYVVHMEPVSNGDGSVTCYECMTDREPDMAVLGEDLKVWKAYVAERELKTAKAQKLAELEAYDSSDAVNGFEVVKDGQAITAWIEPGKRSNYRGSLEDCVLLGVTDIKVPIAGMLIPMTVSDARVKLAQVQLYADSCAIVTERHRAAVAQLHTVQEVEGYDFTTGYPERLTFVV